MLGMNFTSFLTLLIVSVVVAAVYHWILRYRFLEGIDSFLAKVAVGWVGGWLGSPVLGHWLRYSPVVSSCHCNPLRKRKHYGSSRSQRKPCLREAGKRMQH